MTANGHQRGWFTSSYSGGQDENCVEARFTSGGTDIRDSKDPHGPVLSFDADRWARFLQHLRG
jgi:hypothetical protein